MNQNSSDEGEECPELVKAEIVRIPVTIITGYLGNIIIFDFNIVEFISLISQN